MVATTVEAVSPPQTTRDAFTRAALLVVVGIMSTTLGQEQVLGRLPFLNLLKNTLHETRTASSGFFFLAGLAWYFKPLAGILTDAFPLFGSRRLSYLALSAILATLVWIAVIFIPERYDTLLWMMILLGVFMMLASTVVGAVLVQAAQTNGASGRLTSLRFSVQYVCSIVGALAGGYLATVWFGWTALSCAAVVFLIVPVAFLCLREERVKTDTDKVLNDAWRQLKRIGSARTMWAAGGLMALFYIAPGFSTALFYKQQDQLHMLPPAQGFLTTISALGALGGALTYAFACRRFRLRTLLLTNLSIATVATLGFLFYTSVLNAQIIHVVGAYCEALATTAMVDLSVRATPRGSEGLGYAIMISINNLARIGTDTLGSFMLDKLHMPFSTLVLINAGTTAIAVPLVLLLPLALVSKRESETLETVEQLVGAGQEGAFD
jgi:predicted MFS family arabinose efflux permease